MTDVPPASPPRDPTWQGRDVRLGQVLEALDQLRHESERRATRTSVMNLIVVARTRAEADTACAAVNQSGTRHPARTVVLVTEADGQGIDADITLHEAESEGVSLWSEDVVLTVRGTASRHLCSLIEPLTLSDLPVVVWYVASLPPPGDQLVAGATAIVVDSKELGDQRAFADLRALMRQRTLVDLSWVRLRTPRQLLAGLFDGRDYRPFVAGVTSAQVAGKAGPRHLLGGWLVDCLGLPRAEVHLTDARHISLHLVAEAGGRRGTFSVDREEGTRNVRARATIDAGPSHDDVLTLSEGGLGWALGEALTDLEPDVAYLRALQAALGFLG